ncbi:Glucosidase i [Lasiodiplodia theobromae]|uniref:Glucosidase i n=1 Tax=Lasiodiplodia theobromae TaxID=45133 RepID=UPI0015C3365E|nr:Glucosidase i [Lasiodiplodia theobromae]KAF4535015.1 Glucosidase i [Lasiodiplodia theobromae]
MPLRLLLYAYLGLALAASATAHPDNSSLQWGPFRPNLYFGVRPRIHLRHTCEQSDAMAGYGWTAYDPRIGGSQTVHDQGNGLDLTTNFVKDGASWALRVRGTPRSHVDNDNLGTAVIFYLAVDAAGVVCARPPDAPVVDCRADVPGLGPFKLHIRDAVSKNEKTTLHGLHVAVDKLWQAKTIFFDKVNAMNASDTLPGTHNREEGNMQFVQKVFSGAFEFDIVFSPEAYPDPMPSASITHALAAVDASISSRFDAAFSPQPPFDREDYVNCSKSLLSNLLGGIGYFYGDAVVDNSHAPEYDELDLDFWQKAAEARARATPQNMGPYELFSLVPSRPFFPRGFLWDEGFHLLLVLDWDADLAMEIVRSWLSLMDDDGWIAREQILGSEVRSKVPPEFQVQYPHHANPPTLFLVVAAFVDKLTERSPYSGAPSLYLAHPPEAQQLLDELYPLLKRHYHWFRKTQAGDLTSHTRPNSAPDEAYRWKGRTPQHILTSGLDDYPRAQPPHPSELHLDALCWVGSMAGALQTIAEHMGEDADARVFGTHRQRVQQNIDSLHWSAARNTYCDATIKDGAHSLVCHDGYVSLFPFLLGLLGTTHAHLPAVLDLIADDARLWSPHGIRSLSRQDPFYGTDENYWRGPVWININYLVVARLLDLAQSPSSPHQHRARAMYRALRRNVVDTVFNSWRDTGFAWEQYHPDTGAGQRTQHFTGWTALVVKIMALPDLAEQKQPLRPPRPIVAPGGGWGWGVSWVVWLVGLALVVGVFGREVGRGVRLVRARLL